MAAKLDKWLTENFTPDWTKPGAQDEVRNSVIGQVRYGNLDQTAAYDILAELYGRYGNARNAYEGRLNDAVKERDADISQMRKSGDYSYVSPLWNKDFLSKQTGHSFDAPTAPGTGTTPFTSPDLDAFRATIEKNLVPSEDIPTLAAKFRGQVEEAFKPGEEEVQQKLKAEFNASSPWSYGSGGQLKATRDLLIKQSANRMATQISLGTTEYQVKSDMYRAAVGAQGQLAGITSNADLQARQNEWNAEQARLTAAREEASAIKIADMYKPEEKPWWQYLLEPVATGVGYYTGTNFLPTTGKAVKGIYNWAKGSEGV